MGLKTMEFGRIYTERFCVSDYGLGRLPSRLTHVISSRISQHTFLNRADWIAARDSETNLDHTWFRQYSSQLGRWMHPDPAGLAAVDASNPQSWNRYAYVLNNPLRFIDPLGLYPIEDCGEDVGCGDGGLVDPGEGDACAGSTADACVSVSADAPDEPTVSLPAEGYLFYTVRVNSGSANNQNVAKSVTSQCLAGYNSSTATKGVQFFSLYHLATDLRNAWAEWTLLPAGKYALAKTASWISGQIGTTEFLSVTGTTSSTVIPSTTTAVVDLAETAGKAGAVPAIVAGTGLDVLANVGCATVGRQAAGQMTPLPPGWASSF
jgi:RHS repeat-associated protein